MFLHFDYAKIHWQYYKFDIISLKWFELCMHIDQPLGFLILCFEPLLDTLFYEFDNTWNELCIDLI
jgi:hypothetical protein